MSGTVIQNPTTWSVDGNLIDGSVSEPETIDPFTALDCVVSLESAVLVDGVYLVPVKSVPDF